MLCGLCVCDGVCVVCDVGWERCVDGRRAIEMMDVFRKRAIGDDAMV